MVEQITLDRETLSAAWPKCFRARGTGKAPLKIGIDREVIDSGALNIPDERIKAAVADYCTGPKYLFSFFVKGGAKRIGLDGEPVCLVSLRHRRHAKAKLIQMGLWREPADRKAAA